MYDETVKAAAHQRHGVEQSLEAHRAALREYRSSHHWVCNGRCPLCREADRLLGGPPVPPPPEPWHPRGMLVAGLLLAALVAGLVVWVYRG